jgi:hypothetical protein
MEGIDKPHTGKYKEITNDWNYDASCTLTSLPVWDLENFKRLIFVVQSVHEQHGSLTPGIIHFLDEVFRCPRFCRYWPLLRLYSFVNTEIPIPKLGLISDLYLY